jgi:hypothetical protein
MGTVTMRICWAASGVLGIVNGTLAAAGVTATHAPPLLRGLAAAGMLVCGVVLIGYAMAKRP